MTIDELRDGLIRGCGNRMLAAATAGDAVAARFWLDVQTGQIMQRSPAMVAKMEACFFADAGDQARLLAGKGEAHA